LKELGNSISSRSVFAGALVMSSEDKLSRIDAWVCGWASSKDEQWWHHSERVRNSRQGS